MSEPQELRNLDVLADRLRDPAPSLEHRIEAMKGLERGLARFPVAAAGDSSGGESEQNLARAQRITAMTKLGELPELDALAARLDADTMQSLRALFALPMSRVVEDGIRGALDRATQAAREKADRLRELDERAAHDRRYRDLLRDMSELLTLLVGRNAGEITRA